MNNIAREASEGAQFGRFHLVRVLGSGGMGQVWQAQDTDAQRTVALKVWPMVFSYDPVFCSRLQRQARIVGQLDEPRIVPINDFGEIDGQQFVEMPLIDGADLSTLLGSREPLPALRAVTIIGHIATALDAVHAVGVIHGDVKPENILVSEDFAYLVDIGFSEASPRKGIGRVIGSAAQTWKYVAPERFTAPAVDHRVDIYALACVLHECLTGSPPYWAETAGTLISAHLTQPIPRPARLRPDLPQALDKVIAVGMAKDPAERYGSAGELALAAYQALGATDERRDPDVLRCTQRSRGPDTDAERSPISSAAVAPPVVAARPPADAPMGEGHDREVLSERSSPAPSAPTTPPDSPFDARRAGWPAGPGMAPPGLRWATPPHSRRRLVSGSAMVIALAVVGGLAIWLLRPSHSVATVADASSSTQTASAPSPSEAQARLFSLLPRDYPSGTCTPTPPPHGALGAVSCDRNADSDGPLSATYLVFADAAALHSALDRMVGAAAVAECPGRIQSPGPWHRTATPGKPSGMLVCGAQEGNPVLGWTDDNELLLSVAHGGPQGPTIDQLYRWWTSHS